MHRATTVLLWIVILFPISVQSAPPGTVICNNYSVEPVSIMQWAPAAVEVSAVCFDSTHLFVRGLLYRVPWDGTNDRGGHVSSGVYFYRIVAGDFRDTKKMVLLK
jgi:hypothetical protein